jgi:predicted nucleotidyltransferase
MDPLTQLTGKLERHYPGTLVSVILYGSAAAEDYDGKYSDLNILCVLKEIGLRELEEAEIVFRWWREQGNPWPLLMTEREVAKSADAFAVEFRDMKERRRVLYGVDLVEGIEVDGVYYRAEVEHELRAKLLRLRQRAAAILSHEPELLDLCLDSVSTFCVLGRHVLLLTGRQAHWRKRLVVRDLAEAGVIRPASFDTLLDIREGVVAPETVEPRTLFADYLAQVRAMVDFVDNWKS